MIIGGFQGVSYRRDITTLGRGGMNNKLAVARKVARLGTEVVIADGTDPDAA